MKKYFLLPIAFMICTSGFAQQSLKGKVVSSDTHKPIALANVFLGNTTVGTITNEDGEFRIDHFPDGRYDVVVSYIGYESYIVTLQSNHLPANLQVVLKPKVNELQEVIVEPYDKNGWEKWGTFFTENFIGESAFASDCKLLNKDVVKFRFSKKNNKLTAVSTDRLVIENKALGYVLKYDLVHFEYDFNSHVLIYQGYPLFEDMQAKRKRIENRWVKNREEAYYGSMMHFMRSLYRNKLIEQQFEVRKLIKLSDAEKKRVKTIFQSALKRSITNGEVSVEGEFNGYNPDTVAYYRKVLGDPEGLNILIDKVLPGDSIAFAIDSITAGLEFKDYLQVIYKPKQTPREYKKYLPQGVSSMPLSSEIHLTNGQPVVVLANGSYFEATDLITSHYWGWWEKMATMLPNDYKPPPQTGSFFKK